MDGYGFARNCFVVKRVNGATVGTKRLASRCELLRGVPFPHWRLESCEW